jgi:hypothetical protein
LISIFEKSYQGRESKVLRENIREGESHEGEDVVGLIDYDYDESEVALTHDNLDVL